MVKEKIQKIIPRKYLEYKQIMKIQNDKKRIKKNEDLLHTCKIK